jgi:broad specificity phosphatase PhoE
MGMRQTRAWLLRHGATEWSANGRHTGRTDIPLSDEGRAGAWRLADALKGCAFVDVWTSSLSRAAETCRITGLGNRANVLGELREWDYGEYEGLTTAEIREERPNWTLWRDGCPAGETAAVVGIRAQRVVDRIRAAEGDVAIFSHAHFLRVLAATWLGLPPQNGALFALATSSISVLGWEREQQVIERWNESVG